MLFLLCWRHYLPVRVHSQPTLSGGRAAISRQFLSADLIRSGNTRVFASTIARQTGGPLFEIRTEEPYPEDYEAHIDLARRQLEQLNNWFADDCHHRYFLTSRCRSPSFAPVGGLA